jgi:hypothetical protein
MQLNRRYSRGQQNYQPQPGSETNISNPDYGRPDALVLDQQGPQQDMEAAYANYNPTYPAQIKDQDVEDLANLVKLLTQYGDLLEIIRKEWLGQAIIHDENNNPVWVQMTKPIFVLKDKQGRPITKEHSNPILRETGKVEYIPNTDAVEELLSQLKCMGINAITPLSTVSEDNILDDLREFERKLASLLCLKQVEWGLDKEMMPMIMIKIKTIVQDARLVAKEGNLLRALMKSVQRIEQSVEQPKENQSFNPFRRSR